MSGSSDGNLGNNAGKDGAAAGCVAEQGMSAVALRGAPGAGWRRWRAGLQAVVRGNAGIMRERVWRSEALPLQTAAAATQQRPSVLQADGVGGSKAGQAGQAARQWWEHQLTTGRCADTSFIIVLCASSRLYSQTYNRAADKRGDHLRALSYNTECAFFLWRCVRGE